MEGAKFKVDDTAFYLTSNNQIKKCNIYSIKRVLNEYRTHGWCETYYQIAYYAHCKADFPEEDLYTTVEEAMDDMLKKARENI